MIGRSGIDGAGRSFSQLVVVPASEGRWIYVSGQIGIDEFGHFGTAGAQAENCFRSIGRLLSEVEAGLEDVVRVTAYLANLDDYDAYNAARGAAFGDFLPASTTIGVVGLPVAGAVVEVDAVAFSKSSTREPAEVR